MVEFARGETYRSFTGVEYKVLGKGKKFLTVSVGSFTFRIAYFKSTQLGFEYAEKPLKKSTLVFNATSKV